MSLQAYSKCSIQFIPNGKSRDSQRDYSDRSVIDLRQHDYGSYSLRGVDVENKSAVIFNFQLKKSDAYKFGSSANYPDRFQSEDGTYYFLLNPTTRDQFHQELRKCLEQLVSKDQGSSDVDSGKSFGNKSSTESLDSKSITDGNDILIDIHKLGEYIENGAETEAVVLASKLALQHVQLKAKILDKKLNDKELRIRVKIDRIDFRSNDRAEPYNLNVYESTTIHELRALFEYTHHFPSANQYFFVNGHLAYEESTMNDLEVQNNSLFVLFLTEKLQQKNTRF